MRRGEEECQGGWGVGRCLLSVPCDRCMHVQRVPKALGTHNMYMRMYTYVTGTVHINCTCTHAHMQAKGYTKQWSRALTSGGTGSRRRCRHRRPPEMGQRKRAFFCWRLCPSCQRSSASMCVSILFHSTITSIRFHSFPTTSSSICRCTHQVDAGTLRLACSLLNVSPSL